MADEQQAYVNLVEFMGGDLAVVNSARVSYRKSSYELTEKDERLINRLLRDRHGTPFEQAVFTFYVKCPIFVAREWFRHRIGSFNEVSGRYKELETKFYTPTKFRVPDPERATMDYTFKDADPVTNQAATDAVRGAYEYVAAVYHYLVSPVVPTDEQVAKGVTPGLGIAKEHARIVLSVGIYTEFRWTVNARALMNFVSLRTHPTAMKEIRIYAGGIEQIFKNEMPVTHAAFVEHGRIAP